ncbi:MAG TPA: neutral/alkaline non-lysosomal ceramidase N-terminal domain-containing protein [Armatimonadota bacterium]|jgi:neutral ceramidase|nr:neutral/alkaline non-lysosomal ceramidase N-terminal domain-containing protein [Armatimonadota bacterium]HOM83357.1 neutral/alkaline non-lysosomal ceramidase N-terminal domain-containing protein [Armatimonadota bacterium]HPO71191.1 neutral/alkaline non-lysosomal ceramidase N-terminal domain-containing protein [Armatimonadota bacterium]HPT99376.1 neutral/alkaline non-lysosomal ceramidase N-terminal domain-containing protein [Armatimonadota bacterium]
MGTLKIGCGSAVITPGLGAHLAGYFNERRATAVHDDLFARALVFDDGTTRAALLACDVICLPEEEVARVREAIETRTGLSGSSVMVSATHTHTGPQTRAFQLPEDAEPTREWLKTFPERAAGAVVEALEKMEEVQVYHGTAFEDRIAFNRRYRMKDGTVRTNPGYQNPDIVGPAGPIDPEVGVLAYTRADGTRKALLVHYTCHLDNVSGTEISADYPGYLAARLRERLEDQPFVFYAQGACGDINHCDFRSPYPRKGHEHSRWMGETLAGDVCEALRDLKPLEGTPVKIASKMVPLPVREGVEPLATEAEVQAIRVGDVGFVSIPAEYFVEHQLDIKARSPFQRTFVCELANGWVGYVPTRKAFEENMRHVSWERMTGFDHMGYEVRSALSRGFAPGVGEALADGAVELLQSLR